MYPLFKRHSQESGQKSVIVHDSVMKIEIKNHFSKNHLHKMYCTIIQNQNIIFFAWMHPTNLSGSLDFLLY
jgi:hypothetical protein